jgi:DNA-3-methyladenine glycosylase
LAPIEGLDLMQHRRARAPWRKGKPAVEDAQLCRGPGNLATAMGIDLAHNTRALFKRPLTIEDRGIDVGPVTWGPRVGITKGVEHAWRCWVEGNRAVSAIGRTARRKGEG